MKLTDALSLQCENFWGNPILANEIGLVESLIVCRLIWKQERWGDWVEHTQQDFEDALGVSPCMQRRAVGVLKSMKILETKQIRLQHRTFYRIDREVLNDLEDSILERLQQAKERGGTLSPEVRKPHLEDELRKPHLPKLGNRISSKGQYGSLEQEEQERQNVDSDESTPLLEDSESDSPEAPEPTPQDEAAAPPRRAPRMPPPRAIALESPRTSQDGGTDEEAAPLVKTPPTQQSQRMPAATVDPQEVMEAWNEVAEKLGLPRCVAINPKRKARIATLAKDKFWRDNWAAAVDWIPNVDWIVEKRCKCDFEWFLKYDSVIRLAEGRTATPAPSGTPAPAPKPKSKYPVNSPEWEREILRGS